METSAQLAYAGMLRAVDEKIDCIISNSMLSQYPLTAIFALLRVSTQMSLVLRWIEHSRQIIGTYSDFPQGCYFSTKSLALSQYILYICKQGFVVKVIALTKTPISAIFLTVIVY
mgnify:CR=1 FL=1